MPIVIFDFMKLDRLLKDTTRDDSMGKHAISIKCNNQCIVKGITIYFAHIIASYEAGNSQVDGDADF